MIKYKFFANEIFTTNFVSITEMEGLDIRTRLHLDKLSSQLDEEFKIINKFVSELKEKLESNKITKEECDIEFQKLGDSESSLKPCLSLDLIAPIKMSPEQFKAIKLFILE